MRELARMFLAETAQGEDAPVPVLCAMTLWGEARGEPITGVRGVATVMVNRARNPRWWGKTLGEVCTKSTTLKNNRRIYQFSCWNSDDPNRVKLLDPVASDGWETWEKCVRVAIEAISGNLPPLGLDFATHYFSLPLVKPPAAWGKAPKFVTTIGGLQFYAVEPIA